MSPAAWYNPHAAQFQPMLCQRPQSRNETRKAKLAIQSGPPVRQPHEG